MPVIFNPKIMEPVYMIIPSTSTGIVVGVVGGSVDVVCVTGTWYIIVGAAAVPPALTVVVD